MKLTKLFSYMVGLTTPKPEMLTFIRRGNDELEVSCTDGVTHVRTVLAMPGIMERWKHRGMVSVETKTFELGLRDDAMFSVDKNVFSIFGPRWKVSLPCDMLDGDLASNVRAVSGEGITPPDFLNVNTTDAFGADVWVAFSRRKTGGVVALISDYTNTILFGQEVNERGTFPAKLLPATKGLSDIKVRANDEIFSVTGDYQLSAVSKVPVTVTAALPPIEVPGVGELLQLIGSVTGKEFSVNANALRDVVTAVTKLMPKETTNLRMRYTSNAAVRTNSALLVSMSNATGSFSETLQITTRDDGELLLHTKMFATSLKGITLTKDAIAVVVHDDHKIRVEIFDNVAGKGKDKAPERIATIMMVAGDESGEARE